MASSNSAWLGRFFSPVARSKPLSPGTTSLGPVPLDQGGSSAVRSRDERQAAAGRWRLAASSLLAASTSWLRTPAGRNRRLLSWQPLLSTCAMPLDLRQRLPRRERVASLPSCRTDDLRLSTLNNQKAQVRWCIRGPEPRFGPKVPCNQRASRGSI